MEGPVSATWTADRLGDPAGPLVAVFVHGGFWRARYGADTIADLARACSRLSPPPWVWNLEYPRVGLAGGGWPGTAAAVGDAVGAALQAAGHRPVALIGHSAGAHLALWAAGEHPQVSLVVSLAGVCDLAAADDAGLGEGAVREFLGGAPTPELLARASPLHRLALGVPTLLLHGDADRNVPVGQSRSFLVAARRAGDRCDLHELPGADHFEVVDPAGRGWPELRRRLQELGAPSNRDEG
jgi:pimeloyl-ACP methyl ester carboxylesterase